jgi:hypothetical protein
MSPLRTTDLALDRRTVDLASPDGEARHEILELTTQFAAREQELLRERDRLLRAIDELTHRLRRAELLSVHAVRVA